MDIKNIIKPKHQTATGSATDFIVGRFYSVEAKGNSTQLLELKALAAKPMFQPLQISTKSNRRILGTI
jgi:hypothetical protein